METNGKRTAGIVLTVIGSILIFLALVFGGIFCGMSVVFDSAVETNEKEVEEFIDKGAVSCKGIVTDRDDSETEVTYYAEETGEEYTVEFDVSSSDYEEGDSVTVYYDPENPQICMSSELYAETLGIMSSIFLVLGLALGGFFLVLGLTMLIVGIVLYRKAKAEEKKMLYERGF